MPEPSAAPTAAGVVLASGAGTRVGAELNKVYLPLAGRRVISWSLEVFARVREIGVLMLVTRPQDADLVEQVLADAPHPAIEIVHGGASRQESELNALRRLASRIDTGAVDTVLLHDGARPLLTPELITAVLGAVREYGGAVPGLRCGDIAAVDESGSRLDGAPQTGLVRAQTPQGFRAAPLRSAYEQAERVGFVGTDTASCIERFTQLPVHWVPGEPENFKITYPHDLVVAERVLAARQAPLSR